MLIYAVTKLDGGTGHNAGPFHYRITGRMLCIGAYNRVSSVSLGAINGNKPNVIRRHDPS